MSATTTSASSKTTGSPERLVVGAVASLWRYPFKSMLGERLHETAIDAHGVVGDRAWALRDVETGRIASVKKFPRLLECRAAYDLEPTRRRRGRAIVELPDGRHFDADDPFLSDAMSAFLGRTVRVEHEARSHETTGIDRKTVFGDVPVSQMKPDWTAETMPDYFTLKQDSFMEIGAIHVLANGSVATLGRAQGGTAKLDERRFRTNIYVDSLPRWDGFVEDGWLGGVLEIGRSLRCTDFQPTVWCVSCTVAQEDLPRDLTILRATAEHHKGCLGVYGSVASGGVVHVGDPVILVAPPVSSQ
jgi:uncharacterized protein